MSQLHQFQIGETSSEQTVNCKCIPPDSSVCSLICDYRYFRITYDQIKSLLVTKQSKWAKPGIVLLLDAVLNIDESITL